MADLTEDDVWVEGLYRIEIVDPVQGGEEGIDNRNAKRLGSRTRYLRIRVNRIADESGNITLGSDATAKLIKMADAAAANVAAQRLTMRGASAHASSSSNKTGADLDFIPGFGSVPGTDHGGSLRFLLPRAVATITKAFEIWRTSDANAEFSGVGNKLMAVDYYGGQTRVQFQDGSLSGVQTIAGTYTAVIATVYCSLAAQAGAVYLKSSTGEFIRSKTDEVRRSSDILAVDVATTNATPTTLVTLTPTPSRPGTVYEITVCVADVAGNTKAWRTTLVVRVIGSMCEFPGSGSPTAVEVPPDADGPVDACVLDFNTGGATVRARGTGMASTSFACTFDTGTDLVSTSFSSHGLAAYAPVQFSTTGVLPTPLVAGTTYYVRSSGLTSTAFAVSATRGGALIDLGGSPSGTHSVKQRNDLTWSVNVREAS